MFEIRTAHNFSEGLPPLLTAVLNAERPAGIWYIYMFNGARRQNKRNKISKQTNTQRNVRNLFSNALSAKASKASREKSPLRVVETVDIIYRRQKKK